MENTKEPQGYEPTARDAIAITDLLWEALEQREAVIIDLLSRVNDLEQDRAAA